MLYTESNISREFWNIFTKFAVRTGLLNFNFQDTNTSSKREYTIEYTHKREIKYQKRTTRVSTHVVRIFRYQHGMVRRSGRGSGGGVEKAWRGSGGGVEGEWRGSGGGVAWLGG